MDTADQKSIFGILVGLAALFVLWLWASGNASTVLAAINGASTNASSTVGTANPAANTVGGNAAPLGGSTTTTVAVPQYVSTPAAITPSNANAIGGYTVAGAQNGGVSVTPSVFTASNSVPSTTSVDESDALLNILGLGSGALSSSSFGTYSSPTLAANVVGGNSAPL